MIWPFRQSSPPESGPTSQPCKHKEIVDDQGGYVMRNNACVLPSLDLVKKLNDNDDCARCGEDLLDCECDSNANRSRKNPTDIVEGDFYVCGVCKQVWVVSDGYWEISDFTENDILSED